MTILGISIINIGIMLMGIGMVAMAALIFQESRKRQKTGQRIESLISDRRQVKYGPRSITKITTPESIAQSIDQMGIALSQTKFFNQILDQEDITYLSKAGFGTEEGAQRFVLIRLSLTIAGFLFGLILFAGSDDSYFLIKLMGLTGICFLAPKWILKSIAEGREESFQRETVALVDIMRLLQGVGLSVDQSLEVIATQLQDLIPVTGKLLDKARPQVKSGVPWIEMLRRIGNTYSHQDFKALVNVLQQIDKFGGEVQEPLKQFAERLVEKERAAVRERIGKLTIKLTSIMVATMLPGLLILTGGPGVISIMREFQRM